MNNKAPFLITDGARSTARPSPASGRPRRPHLLRGRDHDAHLGLGLRRPRDGTRPGLPNLVGVDGISAGDCTEVSQAVLATEMATNPPNSPAPDAPVCAAGQTPSNLFFDDMEAINGNWSVTGGTVSSRWGYTPGYAHSGLQSLYAPNTTGAVDTSVFRPVDVVLPAGARLWFAHAFDTDAAGLPAERQRRRGHRVLHQRRRRLERRRSVDQRERLHPDRQRAHQRPQRPSGLRRGQQRVPVDSSRPVQPGRPERPLPLALRVRERHR